MTGTGLVCHQLEVSYQGSILALRGVSLDIADAEIVAVIGGNGAGKSTLLRAMSGCLTADGGEVTAGEVLLDGEPISRSSAQSLVQRGVVQVMEGRAVLEHLSVEENLRVAGAAVRQRRRRIDANVAEAYDLFPVLRGARGRPAGHLSGGQRQMLVIARGLIAQPRFLLLDEPSLGLAPVVVDVIFGAIETINRDRGTAIAVVEQNTARTLDVASRAYVIKNGRVVLTGPAAEIRDSGGALTAAYLGDDGDLVGSRHDEAVHVPALPERVDRWLA